MDVVRLEHAAEIGLIRFALAEALEGRFLVPEGLKKGEREFGRVEGLLGERGDGLFDLNGVYAGSHDLS